MISCCCGVDESGSPLFVDQIKSGTPWLPLITCVLPMLSKQDEKTSRRFASRVGRRTKKRTAKVARRHRSCHCLGLRHSCNHERTEGSANHVRIVWRRQWRKRSRRNPERKSVRAAANRRANRRTRSCRNCHRCCCCNFSRKNGCFRNRGGNRRVCCRHFYRKNVFYGTLGGRRLRRRRRIRRRRIRRRTKDEEVRSFEDFI